MDDARPIVRCTACHLRQFQTHDGNCRRCRQSLTRREAVPEPPPPTISPTKPLPRADGGWGEMLAVLRQERGFSQRELAVRAKYVRTFISKAEGRFEPPTCRTVKRFAAALDVPMYVLVSANDGRAYYSEHFLLSDPFLAEIHQLAKGFDENQWHIITDAVRSLALERQLTFPEWQIIPATGGTEVAA